MSTKKKRPAKSSPSASHGRDGQPPVAATKNGLTRRGFLGSSAAAGGVALTAQKARAAGKPKTLGPKKAPITLNVNGKARPVAVEPRSTLLRVLRNQLDLTGPKE